MKKLIIGLLALGLTNLSFSQILNEGVTEVQLEGVTVSPRNSNYLNKVQDLNTPIKVKRLENKAAQYDIKDAGIFDHKFEAYEVIFKQSSGKIIAIYDKEGNVISSSEKFKNLRLPKAVRMGIFEDHDGWELHSDSYLVSYYSGKNVKKLYKVQLRKGKQKKNLRVDVEGNIM